MTNIKETKVRFITPEARVTFPQINPRVEPDWRNVTEVKLIIGIDRGETPDRTVVVHRKGRRIIDCPTKVISRMLVEASQRKDYEAMRWVANVALSALEDIALEYQEDHNIVDMAVLQSVDTIEGR